jgi:DNA-binding response OmpR family regulator
MAPTVLVVEDESLIAMALVDLLNEAGFAVTGPAADLATALACARASPPHVALVDVNLRDGRTGPTIGRELAERHGTVALALSGEGDVETTPASAFVAVVRKPFFDHSVIGAVRAALRLHKDANVWTVSAIERP